MTSERELKILHLLAANDSANQRQVADAAGFSLGLVNNVLRRLAKTGHIKIQNLNARRVRYILTPKGIAEKARQSYAYVHRTVAAFNTCLDRIAAVVDGEVEAGRRRFIVLGEGDVANLVEVALKLRAADGVVYERRTDSAGVSDNKDVRVLDCREPDGTTLGISILTELLETRVPS
jgi:DNA-binding MarR family transcriptional regulator